MHMKKQGSVKGLNLVCAVLMAVLLALQFVPFWTVEDSQVSISSYVWFPGEHKDLEGQLTAQVEGYTLSGMVPMPILLLVLSAAGVVLCIVKRDNALSALVPAACGVIGTIGYLTQPAFRLGSGWELHCLASAAMACVAAVTLTAGARRSA